MMDSHVGEITTLQLAVKNVDRHRSMHLVLFVNDARKQHMSPDRVLHRRRQQRIQLCTAATHGYQLRGQSVRRQTHTDVFRVHPTTVAKMSQQR